LKDDDDNNNNKTVTANKPSEDQKKEQRKNRSLTFSFSSLNNNSLDTSPCSPPPSEPSREEAEAEEEEAAKPKSSSKDPQTSARAYTSKRTDSAFRVRCTARKTDKNDATKDNTQKTIHFLLIIFHYPFLLNHFHKFSINKIFKKSQLIL
jgi:hypothetical protein